jgi:hypothetical protein
MRLGVETMPPNRDARARSDDAATVAAIGVLAATLADLCHETIGHGLGCVGVGGRITLLTSIWFRCQGATALTDAGGSLASLVLGGIVLTLSRRSGTTARLLMILFGAINLFWFAAQLMFHALFNSDDWFFVARQLGWTWIWRPIAATLGIVAYAATIRLTMASLSGPLGLRFRTVCLGYGGAVASAVIAGLMWRPEPVRSAVEGLLTFGFDPVGLLLASRWADRPLTVTGIAPIRRSYLWIVAGLLLFGGFLFIQARGLGPLAGVRVHAGH